MAGGTFLYVRTPSVADIRAAVPARIDVTLDDDAEFALLKGSESWYEIAANLAKAGRECVILGGQVATGAFEFVHLGGGRMLRHLANGRRNEGVWEIVKGSPENWEPDAFDAPPREGLEEGVPSAHAIETVAIHYRLTGFTLPVRPAKKPPSAKKQAQLAAAAAAAAAKAAPAPVAAPVKGAPGKAVAPIAAKAAPAKTAPAAVKKPVDKPKSKKH